MANDALKAFGISGEINGAAIGGEWLKTGGKTLTVTSPIDRAVLGTIKSAAPADTNAVIDAAHAAFLKWRVVPAPRRGEFVRRVGEKLRMYKAEPGKIVSLEVGKITQEAQGEVQEMIDICDFAVGLSRQLYGLTVIVSERPGHPDDGAVASASVRSA